MPTAIELTASDIRLVRIDDGSIQAMEVYPIPADTDPITALASAPLPQPLGPVHVTLNHNDMLLRTMIQPPAPPERMERIIRFELQSVAGDSGEMLVSWHIPAVGGGGDMRVLAMLCKPQLAERLQEAIATHHGKLTSLIDPNVALYQLFKAKMPGDVGNHVLLDCCNDQVHMAFVQDGELLFFRTHKPGSQELVDAVAELRGLDTENAERLLRKLGHNPPEDIVDLIARHCSGLAAAVNNNIRFAKSQLKMTDYTPTSVYLTGKGARVNGFTAALSERLKLPVRPFNPFAGALCALPSETMDGFAQLPGAWGNAVGLAASDAPILDVLEQLRQQRRQFWQTSGLLRSGAAIAVAVMIVALVMQMVRIGIQDSALDVLKGTQGSGLVPKAEKANADAQKQIQSKNDMRTRLRYLSNERRPAKVINELLNVIAEIQDPKERPVYIKEVRMLRNGDGILRIEIEGFAEAGSDKRKRSTVLNTFKSQLLERYPVITSVSNQQVASGSQTLPFRWILTIPDQPYS